ncbi:N-acetylglucosamine kinase [Uniformispora flossi]|uniref:N-acetylglucosamine kinase n=1 Tax=Uniformispora flossi TaxID=3390723 RepID=UPI003C2EC7CB
MGPVTGTAEPATPDVIVAVDGGNSKTDVAVATSDGRLLARVRGPGFEPQVRGVEAAVDVVGGLIAEAASAAGVTLPVRHVEACVANADLPVEEKRLLTAVEQRAWGRTASVVNDTFAVLRSGTAAADAVAVVCGAGINCVGCAADGSTARFPALGRITGDWGGGGGLFEEVLWWSVRAEDGRGPSTALAPAAARHFGVATATEVASRAHLGSLPWGRLHELVPVLCAVAAEGDGVAGAILDRQAEEVALLALTALRRLGLVEKEVDVVLGGGILAARPARLIAGIRLRVGARAPLARIVVAGVPPIAGAVLRGLDAVGGGGAAVEARVRAGFA